VATLVGWVAFVVGLVVFAAYTLSAFVALINMPGLWKLAAFVAPLAALLLPFFGQGEVFGYEVQSFVWWWLFLTCVALLMIATRGPTQVVVKYQTTTLASCA
jgi:hypothetical protein